MTLVLPLMALDIDEKLTLRILKLSRTRKTVLINRGVEDGLKVGDHAKFYLTTGMIARGVVVKTSPARSVWSLYRIIDPASLFKNKVVYLKIATPVKITPDPTKMVIVEPVAEPGTDIPISPDAEALELAAEASEEMREEKEEQSQNEGELASLAEPPEGTELADEVPSETPPPPLSPMAGRLFSHSWEIATYGHLSGLTGKIKSSQPTQQTGQPVEDNSDFLSGYDLGFSLEKYFLKTNVPALQRLSLSLISHFGKNNTLDIQGNSLSSSFWEGGVGVSYHFFNHPGHRERPIFYATVSGGLGQSTDLSQFSAAAFNAGVLPTTETTNPEKEGDSFYYYAGIGLKYYFSRWGGKLQLDYYQRQETYEGEINDLTTGLVTTAENERTLAGPRLILGVLLRF